MWHFPHCHRLFSKFPLFPPFPSPTSWKFGGKLKLSAYLQVQLRTPSFSSKSLPLWLPHLPHILSLASPFFLRQITSSYPCCCFDSLLTLPPAQLVQSFYNECTSKVFLSSAAASDRGHALQVSQHLRIAWLFSALPICSRLLHFMMRIMDSSNQQP